MRTPKENFKISIAATFGTLVPKFLQLLVRFKRHNYKEEAQPAIYAIWHGWQYCLGGIPNRENINILISQSNDGEIVARIAQNMGFSAIRGSMGRGGMKATREILRALEEGKNIAYTVDGPRGPGFKVKEGIIKIAQMSKMPIIPVYGNSSLKLEINSWDKYQIPLPFAQVPLHFGDPIHVPEGEEHKEEYRQKLENELLRLMEYC